MNSSKKSDIIFWGITITVYTVISILSWNNSYFWDNTQHTSIEAHWYYLTDFQSFFIPKTNSEYGIVSTGAPVFLPLLTAFLWKTIAYKVWISHALILVISAFLLYNTRQLAKNLFPEKHSAIVAIIILLESSILTQFSIAGPDFILFTTFVITIRGVFENKPGIILFGAPVLFLISTRGTFTGSIVLVSHLILNILSNSSKKPNFIRLLLPYLPALILTTVYYGSYFYYMGWFFTDSGFGEAHKAPDSFKLVTGNILDLGLRLLENGRIIFWIIAGISGYKLIRNKLILSEQSKFMVILFTLLTMLYVLFACITKMPFLTRYFMPHILLLILFGMLYIVNHTSNKSIYIVLILLFEISGHFWIYPEKMTKIWDSTLAHMPFYSLREECYDYINEHDIDYNDISAGFCMYDNRQFYDLTPNTGEIIGRDMNRKYFIYSNISNIPDDDIVKFKDPVRWKPLNKFEKWPVTIILYQNLHYKALKTIKKNT